MTVLHVLDVRLIEIRRLRRPQLRVVDLEGEMALTVMVDIRGVLVANQLAGSITEFYFEAQFGIQWTASAYGDVDDGLVIMDFPGADESLPGINPVAARGDEWRWLLSAVSSRQFLVE